MRVNEIGATAGGGVARGRLGDGFEGPACRHEQEDEDGRIEQRSPRPVVERAPCAPHRPAHEEQKQDGPYPSGEPEDAIARRQSHEHEPDNSRGNPRKSPRLRLIGPAARSDCQEQEAHAESEQRTTGDLALITAAEDDENEQQSQDEARNDRAEHDEADVTCSRAFVAVGGLS